MRKFIFSLLGVVLSVAVATAHKPPRDNETPERSEQVVSFRNNCDLAKEQKEQAINNVRARLTTGGDVWWDGNNARYIVPKVPPGQPEVASIFAGAVWLGGVDAGGNLKVAAQTYGRSSGASDFWPGPLTPLTDPNPGQTDQETCAQWDKFFEVTGAEIDEFLRLYEEASASGESLDPNLIPRGVKGWPARGNRFFFEQHGFDLPDTQQGLAPFFDRDGDFVYEPTDGDYPVIEIRGCDIQEDPQYPDDMFFWIYNDNGNVHTESNSDAIQMEIQVQAFAYATNDELNDMTFQRYKLINRAIEPIDSTYFAMWVDPDLGCYTDDFVGCDTSRSLAYIYNQDALDGQPGCTCPQGVDTYCDEIPILGVDYFRGPRGPVKVDENGNIFEPGTPGTEEFKDTLVELGMSSFTYYHNSGDAVPPAMQDPQNGPQYYNYLTGSWRTGEPFQFGGDAYQEGTENIDYAFIDPPNDDSDGAWSMCSQNLPPGDRRTIQATGPFRLDPGAVNELIIGVVWVADQDYPCPGIESLQSADDIAQALFDNCFDITDGPDAPDLDIIELDQELILVLTNDTITSNNAFEEYEEVGLQIPEFAEDSLYFFEGYRIYQVAGPNIGLTEENRNDPNLVRQVAQVDIVNNVTEIFNWNSTIGPGEESFFVPTLMVDGNNNGIRHSFRITQDAFGGGDLVNHRPYYYTVVAYAHNDYEPYNPATNIGQREPYLEGRRNIGPNADGLPYTAIPRPIVDRDLNASYGDGAVITRLDGIGTGRNFLDVSEETRERIENEVIVGGGEFNGEITYAPGRGPIEILVFNPLDVRDGNYELQFIDEDLNDERLEREARWVLRDPEQPDVEIFSAQTIEKLNEQIIKEFGFAVVIGQVPEPGTNVTNDNGYIGAEVEYAEGEDAREWLGFIPEGFNPFPTFDFDDDAFDYYSTQPGERDDDLDQNLGLTQFGETPFMPYYLLDFRPRSEFDQPYISPVYNESANPSEFVRNESSLADLNNVDIVLTPNKDLWSRCVIVESANRYYSNVPALETVGDAEQFDLRADSSVTKEADENGLPIPDDSESRQGFGWFPGYAIDVETGKRLNIFFGENSVYGNGNFPDEDYTDGGGRGADMMFNPSSQIILENALDNLGTGERFLPDAYYAGGQHMVYVTRQEYDGCERLYTAFNGPSFLKATGLVNVTWAGLLLPAGDNQMTSYADGLIPSEVRIKMRVTNPYQVEVDNKDLDGDQRTGTGDNNYHPLYEFTLDGLQADELTAEGVEDALDQILVVPNPYYGFSEYETSQFTDIVKITNLPAECTVTIYTLEGKFIRQYQRDEEGIVPEGNSRAVQRAQINPALEWDLRNNKGIPVASGVYLIHVSAPGLGERTIKWFGIARQFDPSGL